MNIAVTGATGFIGRYIVRQLAQAGHDCRCWYRPESDRQGLEDLNEHIAWLLGDLGDPEACRELVDGCQAVVHAALFHVGGGFRGGEGELLPFVERNVLGTLALIESANGLPTDKSKAYIALRRLATLAIRSSKDDEDVLISADCYTDPPDRVMQRLIESACSSSQTYECVFPIVGEQNDIQTILRPANIQLMRPTDLPQAEVEQLQCAYIQVHFVHMTVEANSSRDAVSRSRNLLTTNVDIFNLYSNRAALRIADSVFVKKTDSEQFLFIDQASQTFRRLYPRSRAAEDSLNTLELISQQRLDDRVLSALELYSLAVSNSERRVKLINLWSALECLAGCCDEKSVIVRVIHLVAPSMVWRRVDKIVRYAAIAAKELADATSNSGFGSGFTRSRPTFVHPWDLMLTLCKPEDHEDIVQFLKFCSPHPLLVYRVYRLWEDFHNPKSLKSSLTKSQVRIEWQLWRIYRARNILIHNGEEVSDLPALLDNLQYYVSIVISRIIHGMKIDEKWGVRESLEYWNSKSRYILDSLETASQRLRVSDFFPRKSLPQAPYLWT